MSVSALRQKGHRQSLQAIIICGGPNQYLATDMLISAALKLLVRGFERCNQHQRQHQHFAYRHFAYYVYMRRAGAGASAGVDISCAFACYCLVCLFMLKLLNGL